MQRLRKMKKQTLLLPGGTEFVKFSEIAKLVADAMHPGDDDDDVAAFHAGAARLNLEGELHGAAIHGVLPLKDPETLAPCLFPLPMALVDVDDLRDYFKERLTIEVEAAPGKCESVQHEPVEAEAPSGESVADQNFGTSLSMRDYFAAKAMQGMLANPKLEKQIIQQGQSWIEKTAWIVADAMIKTRSECHD